VHILNMERSYVMKAYRHGEMVLIPVPENLQSQWQDLYEQAGQKMKSPRVIAEGEITGHKHEFVGGQVDAKTLSEDSAMAKGAKTSGYVSRRSLLRALGIGAIAGPVVLLKVAQAAPALASQEAAGEASRTQCLADTGRQVRSIRTTRVR